MNEYEKIAKEIRKRVSRLALQQQRELLQLYDDVIKELAEKASKSKSKSLTERWVKDYLEELKKARKELVKELNKSIKDYTTKAAKAGTEVEQQILSKAFQLAGIDPGDHFKTMFSQVQDKVVKDIISGNLYKDKRTLSSRIWSYGKEFEKNIQYTINQAILGKKSAIELAKDLEQFVKEPAKRPTTWSKAYPNLKNKRVDYNAMRLARTSINHAYQTSTIQSSNMNPFVEGIEWRSALIHGRTCEVCMERHGKIYPKDNVPLDHPNGLCTMIPVVVDNIVDQLADWLNSPDGTYPEIDEFAKNFGYIAKPVSAQFDSTVWDEAMKKQDLRTMESWCEDWLKEISPEERDSIEIYTMSAYFDMNSYLRGLTSSTYYTNEIKQLTAALEKASLPEEVIVRRGADYNILTELGVDISEANKDKLVGAIVTDKGFMSTSPDPHGGFTKAIEYVIKLPKGSQAMYIDPISVNRGEREILINRGGKYIIEDVEFIEVNNRSYVKKIYMTLKNLKSPK